VVRGGGLRRTLDRFLERDCGARGVGGRRDRRERLWARVRERRSVARRAAVTSAEGGSPKMKNLMKAPMRMTTESWPRSRPCVKERLLCYIRTACSMARASHYLRRFNLCERRSKGRHRGMIISSCLLEKHGRRSNLSLSVKPRENLVTACTWMGK
jgi:hypothetical protein